MFACIATVSISGNLEDKLKAIAAAGYRYVEIFENDLISFPGTAREAGELATSLGLKIVTLQPFRDFEGLSGRQRKQIMDYAEMKFEIMDELGTDLLMVCSSTRADSSPSIKAAVEDFYELGERAGKHNMRVAYEALAWGTHVNEYQRSWEIVRQVNHPAVGLVLDTFHIFSKSSDLEMIQFIPGEKIFLVQTADAPRLSMDHLSWSRHYRCFPGQGELKLDNFMGLLEGTGYSGPVSHEIFNDTFRMANADTIAADGYRSSMYLLSMTTHCFNGGIPAAQTIEGLEFIEISVPKGRIESIENLLGALGFQQTGTHHRLPVTHWKSGNANLLINNDETFAQTFRVADDVCVSAIGVQVENAQLAEERANKLGFNVITADSVHASHGMSAIKGNDGVLCYLVDKELSGHLWREEFVSDLNGSLPFVLKDSDHISISTQYEDYLATVLQYRALFDLDISSSFDVVDPKGLIQSQAMSARNNSFRLVLNTSAASNTVSNQFLRKSGGGGVQHIAFSSENIMEAARVLLGNGVDTLSFGDSYYRDIEARYGLEKELVNDLRDLNILYDQDAHGAFFQLYTLPLDGSFQIEIVQRDEYQGLGAANAFLRTGAMQMAHDTTK